MAGLPAYTSAPGTLITSHAMQTLGLQALPAAWLIQTPHALTAAQIQTARKAAATSGLYVETRTSPASLAPYGTGRRRPGSPWPSASWP